MESTTGEGEPRQLYEVLLIILPYLPSLHEILSMSQACRFLKNAMKQETMLWKNIVVERPLSSRLSDEILTEITSKANGYLKSLVLRDCLRITDDGLQCVVQRNPLITKMIVPGCTGLTIEGIIRSVKTLTKNGHTLETLHINGIYSITKHHLSTLHTHLPPRSQTRNEPIDVDICPKCDEVKMVLDCSRETCKKNKMKNKGDNDVWWRYECKACRFCIPRCVECGGCVAPEEEIQEAACEDVLCLDCWLRLSKCAFCNKPYCKRHAHLGSRNATANTTASSAFLCEVCHLSDRLDDYIGF